MEYMTGTNRSTLEPVEHIWADYLRAVPPDAWRTFLDMHQRVASRVEKVNAQLTGYLEPSGLPTRATQIANMAAALHEAAADLELLAQRLNKLDETFDSITEHEAVAISKPFPR